MGLRGRTNFIDYRCFFITTTCYGFKHLFADERYYKILGHSLQFLNKKYQVSTLAYVFMPNHIHLVLNFNARNHLSSYMRDFKKFTSFKIRKLIELDGKVDLLNSLKYENGKQKFKVWQDRFDDVMIETDEVLATKINYIHLNPIRANMVKYPEDYQYSSAHFYEDINNIYPLMESFNK